MRETCNEFSRPGIRHMVVAVLMSVSTETLAQGYEPLRDQGNQETAQEKKLKFKGAKIEFEMPLGHETSDPRPGYLKTGYKLDTTYYRPLRALSPSLENIGETVQNFENQCRVRIADELAVNLPAAKPQPVLVEAVPKSTPVLTKNSKQSINIFKMADEEQMKIFMEIYRDKPNQSLAEKIKTLQRKINNY